MGIVRTNDYQEIGLLYAVLHNTHKLYHIQSENGISVKYQNIYD